MLGTQSGHEGAAHCRESLQSTPAHRQTSRLLPVLRTYFRSSDARRSVGVGKKRPNSPLLCASRGKIAAGFTRRRRSGCWSPQHCASQGAARSRCPARGRGSGGQRREPPTSTLERAGSRWVEPEPAPGASANPSASPSCFAGRPRTHIHSSGAVTSVRRLERGLDRKRSGELSRRMPGCWLCPHAARQRWQGRQSG